MTKRETYLHLILKYLSTNDLSSQKRNNNNNNKNNDTIKSIKSFENGSINGNNRNNERIQNIEREATLFHESSNHNKQTQRGLASNSGENVSKIFSAASEDVYGSNYSKRAGISLTSTFKHSGSNFSVAYLRQGAAELWSNISASTIDDRRAKVAFRDTFNELTGPSCGCTSLSRPLPRVWSFHGHCVGPPPPRDKLPPKIPECGKCFVANA